MPRSNLAKTITLRVSLVPRLQIYHKEEIKKDPRATNEDFGGFLNDKLEQLLDKEEYAKSNFPNCTVLSISDNVIYIKDRVLKGVVEVYYLFLNDLMTSRLFCQYDESFSCVHIVYAVATLDVAKLDPGAYKEARDNMGQQFMKEIKDKFQRKINLQRQRPVDKRVGAAKMRSRSRQDLELNKSQDNVFDV
jgi:hypothetical protein